MTETWYRYTNTKYAAPLDEYEMPMGTGSIGITLHKYTVLKHTPKGVWLQHEYGGEKRFVLNDAYKRFACPTVDDAKVSFIARKRKQIRIYEGRAHEARQAIALIERGHGSAEFCGFKELLHG